MRSRWRQILGYFLVALALGGGVGVAYYWRHRETGAPAAPGGGAPLVSIQRPVLKRSEGGKLAWQIRLKQINITQGQGEISAEGIQEALIYNSSGAPLVRVTAQRVVGQPAGRDFAVSGAVTVVSYQGVVVSTDALQWNQGAGKIVCPGTVTARSKDLMFSTTGLTYDLNAAQIQAPGQVNLYNGENKLIGNDLNYNVGTGNFTMATTQIIFNAEEAQKLLGKKGTL
jgi:hypothetical protein